MSFSGGDLCWRSTPSGSFRGAPYLPVIFFFSRRAAQFVSPLPDILEHLKIIIAKKKKWCSNEANNCCSVCGREPGLRAVTLHFVCPDRLSIDVASNLTHAIIIGWARGDANYGGFIKMHLKEVRNVCSEVKLPFRLSLNLSLFFCQPLLNFLRSWKRSEAALHLWRRIFVSCGKLRGI